MKRAVITVILLILGVAVYAAEAADSTEAHHVLRDVEVVGVKTNTGTDVPKEVTNISRAQILNLGIESAKGASIFTPNFFMPRYGSRMTSSVYVRGLGARIDQPVVGLTVDNIPYMNKDNFDFDIADIATIEVLRGAQAVLNGRNTMGGQINIRTFSPLVTDGVRAMVEMGSADMYSGNASYYHRISRVLGMSVSLQYRHEGTHFNNVYSGHGVGLENNGSLRWKTVVQPSARFSITNTAVLAFDRQDGYPYRNVTNGLIAYNDSCGYRRMSFADGISAVWQAPGFTLTSNTSVQYLDDSMTLDQDFLPEDYFTITQDRHECTVTEDLFARGRKGAYGWLTGLFGYWKTIGMDAPVTFYDTGISRLIEENRNAINPQYPIRWDSRSFVLGSTFDNGSRGIALYHQSSYEWDRWKVEAGLRLDIERASLSYRSRTATGYTTMHVLPDGSMETFSHTPINIDDRGGLHKTFIELLPKVTVQYRFDPASVYFSFSKAYKAGGYNTQMFSDVLQQRIMSEMGMSSLYTLDDIVGYAPEHSYNFELGAHTAQLNDRLTADLTAFLILCRDQQLTVFPPGTVTGRMMTNAGRTRSVGAELSVRYRPFDDLEAYLAYGHTTARFTRYNDGKEDYRGRRVPYAPANTLFVSVTYRVTPFTFYSITPIAELSASCAGPIYWDEANTIRQPFYCVPSITIGLTASSWSVRLWARNFLDTRYDTFYFKSMGNSFAQRGLPRTLGATLRLSI